MATSPDRADRVASIAAEVAELEDAAGAFVFYLDPLTATQHASASTFDELLAVAESALERAGEAVEARQHQPCAFHLLLEELRKRVADGGAS